MPKKKVLLVDDEKDLLGLIGSRIEMWGYSLITAPDGMTAINAVKNEKPDIVVLDYIMPEVDGIEVLEQIRKIDKKIPVIMFSGHPDTRSYVPKLSVYSEGASNLKTALSMLEKK